MPVPRIPTTHEPQTLDEVRDWHGGMVDALVDQRAAVLRAIAEGSFVRPRFVGLAEREVDALYDADRRELDRLTVLNLVASTEGWIKSDFFDRVRRKRADPRKDPLSSAYQIWHATLSGRKQLRPDFDEEGLLDVLRTTAVPNHVISRFRECLPVRHWVGHGRNWDKPNAVDRLDPDDVYDRADALLRAVDSL